MMYLGSFTCTVADLGLHGFCSIASLRKELASQKSQQNQYDKPIPNAKILPINGINMVYFVVYIVL